MLNKMITFKDGIYKNLVGYVTEINGGIATVYLIHEDREVKEIMLYMELFQGEVVTPDCGFFIKQVENEKNFYELYYMRDFEGYAIYKYYRSFGVLSLDETLFLKSQTNAIEVLEGLTQ